MSNRTTRILQTIAAVLGLVGYLTLPSCDARYGDIYTASVGELTSRYGMGLGLLGLALVLLLVSFIPEKDEDGRRKQHGSSRRQR